MNQPPSEVHSPPIKRASLLFQLAAFSSIVFLLTVFAMVATAFGDQTAPSNRWLNRHAGQLIAVEVVVTLSLGFVAMAQDRRQTLRERANVESHSHSESAPQP